MTFGPATPEPVTARLYVYDVAGAHIGTVPATVGIEGGALSIIDAKVPTAFVTPLGARRSHSVSLYPERHEKHRKMVLVEGLS